MKFSFIKKYSTIAKKKKEELEKPKLNHLYGENNRIYDLSSPVHNRPGKKTLKELFMSRYRRTKKIIYLILEEPESSRIAVRVNLFLQICILVSTSLVVSDSVEDFTNNDSYQFYSNLAEELLFVVFSTELVSRLICCTAFGESMKSYVKKPFFWIDCASVLPFFVEIFSSASISQLRVFRIVRFTRILRLFKISRYLKRIFILTEGLSRSGQSFGFLCLALLISNLFWATIFFFSDPNSKEFFTFISFTFLNADDQGSSDNSWKGSEKSVSSLFDAIWWSFVTTTTVGYGDKVPDTIHGKIIASLAALFGTLILSLPISIIGMNFNNTFEERLELDKISEIKKHAFEGKDMRTHEEEQLYFLSKRLEIIKKNNLRLFNMLKKSDELSQAITKSIKLLFIKLHREFDLLQEENFLETRAKGIDTKIEYMEKILRARKKIKIANLFLRREESNKSESDLIVNSAHFKENSAHITENVKDLNTSSYRHSLKSLKLIRSNTTNINSQQKKKKVLIKSNSTDFENEVVRFRNEKLGVLPFEFLNEVFSEKVDMIIKDTESDYKEVASECLFENKLKGKELKRDEEARGGGGSVIKRSGSFNMFKKIPLEDPQETMRRLLTPLPEELSSIIDGQSPRRNSKNITKMESFGNLELADGSLTRRNAQNLVASRSQDEIGFNRTRPRSSTHKIDPGDPLFDIGRESRFESREPLAFESHRSKFLKSERNTELSTFREENVAPLISEGLKNTAKNQVINKLRYL